MIILPSNSSGEYEVANSLRFDSTKGTYLNFNQSTATSSKKMTYSTWFKISKTNDYNILLENRASPHSGQIVIQDDGNNNDLRFYDYDGSTNIDLLTSQAFRDVSAWYHIVVAMDTTQSTASNRVKIYVNGSQVTEFDTETYPSQNYDTAITDGDLQIGRQATSIYYLDGYLAETVFVDGQQLDPTNFGEFDSDTNIWKPKAIDTSSITFGNNGFYLDYKDSSALGNDVSGNNNDLTTNNITSVDQTTDTCTNNFATMNPLDNYYQNSTFSNGNLKITTDAVKENYGTSTFGISQGKWYWEVKITASGSNRDFVGIADKVAEASDFTPYSGNSKVRSYYGFTGVSVEGSTGTAYGDTFTTGDIISVAVDLDNHKLYFAKNGTWQNSGDPTSGATGTGALSIDQNPASGFYYAQFSNIHNTSSTFEINFGNPTFSISSGNSDGNGYGNFEYSVPANYYSLNSKNLARYG